MQAEQAGKLGRLEIVYCILYPNTEMCNLRHMLQNTRWHILTVIKENITMLRCTRYDLLNFALKYDIPYFPF